MKKSLFKNYNLGLLLSILCLLTACTSQETGPREVININAEWKYSQGDFAGAEQMNYEDGNWEQVGLPHSFSIPYFKLDRCCHRVSIRGNQFRKHIGTGTHLIKEHRLSIGSPDTNRF